MAKTSTENVTTPAELVPVSLRLADSQLAGIDSFESAIALLGTITGSEIEAVGDYGNGFALIAAADKSRLVGLDFVILSWTFRGSEDFVGQQDTTTFQSSAARAAAVKAGTGNVYVSCEIVAANGDKLVLNDGGAGILRQLDNISAIREANGRTRDAYVGLIVRGGLVCSEYKTADGSKARTYYLSER